MYSTPPCPSLAASTAAYRRRSFSDSQPKNRFIFCSTSAAYTSIPHSLIRHLLWGKDTAAQTVREVIFDHILRAFYRAREGRGADATQQLRVAMIDIYDRERRTEKEEERIDRTLGDEGMIEFAFDDAELP